MRSLCAAYAQRLLDEALSQEDERERVARHEKNQRTIARLQCWADEADAMTEDEKAQAKIERHETARSIDKNHTSCRKLFPKHAKEQLTENAE